MFDSLQDVYDQVRQRGGLLARRASDPSVAPTGDDEPALEPYVRQGLVEIATKTHRIDDAVRIDVEAGTAQYALPAHVDRIREAVYDQGTATHALAIEDGHDVMKRAEHPNAKSGPPKQIGLQSGSVWLWPVPNGAGTLRLYVTQNGAYEESPPPESDVPSVDEVLSALPPELERTMVDYVLSQWFADVGEQDLSQMLIESYYKDIDSAQRDPHRKRQTTRQYRPLGLY